MKLIVFLLVLTPIVLTAQTNPPSPSKVTSSETNEAKDSKEGKQPTRGYKLYGAPWRIDGNFVTNIQIKNAMVLSSIRVTAVLYMSDGFPLQLPDIELKATGVTTVNVNSALLNAHGTVLQHISEYGMAELIYHYPSGNHVLASMISVDKARSLSFTTMFEEVMPMGAAGEQVLEGLWWKHTSEVSRRVSISNVSSETRDVTTTVVDRDGNMTGERALSLKRHSTVWIDVDSEEGRRFSNARRNRDSNLLGGITVRFRGNAGDVLVSGTLSDDNRGYSANMPLWMVTGEMGMTTTPIRYGSAGIMIGKPDPMMMFPQETSFTPYLVLRNTTDRGLHVNVELNFMSASGPRELPLKGVELGPKQAREVDLSTQIRSAGVDLGNSANLLLSHDGMPGDLVFATGSEDQSKNYVFAVEPQGIDNPAKRRIGLYWSTADDNNTMFTLWNPSDKDEDFTMTLFLGNGEGQYEQKLHLVAKASLGVDVMELLKNIASSAREGSIRFEAAGAETENIQLVAASGIYDVEHATCNVTWIQCCGLSNNSATINPSSFSIYIGQSQNLTAQWLDCQAMPHTQATWSSGNPGVARLDPPSTATGISAGNTTITADFGTIIVYSGQLCAPSPECPTADVPVRSSATVNNPSVSIAINTSSTVHSDNSQQSGFTVTTGSSSVGMKIANTSTFKACIAALEFVGTVTPSNYTGTINMNRTVWSWAGYKGSTLTGGDTSPADDSEYPNNDSNPQSGGSAGHIYDWDSPGLQWTGTQSINTTYRFRVNFQEGAILPDGTPTGGSGADYFVRVSCSFDSNHTAHFVNDVPGDNTWGMGTTLLSWNLQ